MDRGGLNPAVDANRLKTKMPSTSQHNHYYAKVNTVSPAEIMNDLVYIIRSRISYTIDSLLPHI